MDTAKPSLFGAITDVRFTNLRGDLYGGVTAAIIALPLALAFGVASGAGAIAGLYGAIFVGFFAALFGGTKTQVSGPTGPMTVVMASIFTHFADRPALAFTTVILGGALQIVFGVLKLGRYVAFVPFTVISGFMSGIGCIIMIIEIAPLFGHPGSKHGVLEALTEIPQAVGNPAMDATIIGLITLGIVVFTPRVIARLVPPPLIALVAGTLGALWFLPGAPVIGDIPTGLPQPILPHLTLATLSQVLVSAFVLALLGTIDTLLTSLIADAVTGTHHKSDKELIGQGIGNMMAGLFGGIPGAGATMRTMVNIRAGASTPLSGVIHALILFALVAGLAPLAEHIPLAVLAGILLKVGWDIIDWDYLKRLRGAHRTGILIMATVLVLTVLVDLIMAVAIGIIMAALISASKMSDVQLKQFSVVGKDWESLPLDKEESSLLAKGKGRILLIRFTGAFSFCSAKAISRAVPEFQDERVVVIDCCEATGFDTSTVMTIDALVQRSLSQNIAVVVAGEGREATSLLARMRVLDAVPAENRLPGRIAALRRAAELAA
jgi:SulP family sulfate permease